MVSISTSGLELWGFEFSGRSLVWGHKTRVTIYLHTSFLRHTKAGRGSSKARVKNQKYPFRILNNVALKIRKTPKTRFCTEAKISKSERLYNGVMLKTSPTKGHKESR